MMQEDRPYGPRGTGRTPFLPWLLFSTAFLAWLIFQTYELVTERAQLQALSAAQIGMVEAATKVRNSLDAVASRTAKLDREGNPNAHIIVEEARKRGVTINPDGMPKPN